MNNLKERNLVPNGIQETSEDPQGFIYPTYRAASTETQRDMPSLKGSHQDVAYVSSAVGGSLSTLSFEDTPLLRTSSVFIGVAVVVLETG
jgi:hypothetical protein